MTVNHGVLGSSPCSGADARGLRKVLYKVQRSVREMICATEMKSIENFFNKNLEFLKKELPLQSQAIFKGA